MVILLTFYCNFINNDNDLVIALSNNFFSNHLPDKMGNKGESESKNTQTKTSLL